jgi:hypothetical protein
MILRPQDESEARTYLNAMNYRFLLDDILQEMRKHIKYTEEKDWPNLEKFREWMYEQIKEYNIEVF